MAAVADVYDDIEPRIRSELQTTGEMGPEDLPVSENQTEFMELFARRNPDATFEEDGPRLTVSETESFDLEVVVRFEEGGEKRPATIRVDGPTVNETRDIETHLAEEVPFQDVPPGTYDVEVKSSVSGLGASTTSVTVDGDTTADLEIPEVALRERVCADVDVAIDDFVEDLGPQLSERFESDGYVTSNMDLGMAAEYLPCLLVTWAEETGKEAIELDDGIAVFTADEIGPELENVIEFNLERGEPISLDEIQTEFLSNRVPKEVITGVFETLSVDENIVIKDDKLQYEDT
jgi:hypothetical protein